MASVVLAATARARPSLLLRPSATPEIPITPALKLKLKLKLCAVKAAAPIDFRLKKNVLRWRRPVSAASNSNPNPGGDGGDEGDGDSIEDSSGEDSSGGVKTKTNDTNDGAAQGPPLLTILAGFLLLLLVFWVVGSILMWLISLIVSFCLPK